MLLTSVIEPQDPARGGPATAIPSPAGFLFSGPTQMKTHYDHDADALYVRFAEGKVVESEEVAPGVVIDFDPDGKIIALELLAASRQLAAGAIPPIAAE